MYKPGDDKLEVRELLVKAFASAWEAGDKAVDRDTYINSSINVIDSLQVGPEMIYGEEGQGLLDDELDHLPDMLRADGAWVYYAVPAENYFILTWMEDAEKAAIRAEREKELEAKRLETERLRAEGKTAVALSCGNNGGNKLRQGGA